MGAAMKETEVGRYPLRLTKWPFLHAQRMLVHGGTRAIRSLVPVVGLMDGGGVDVEKLLENIQTKDGLTRFASAVVALEDEKVIALLPDCMKGIEVTAQGHGVFDLGQPGAQDAFYLIDDSVTLQWEFMLANLAFQFEADFSRLSGLVAGFTKNDGGDQTAEPSARQGTSNPA